METLLRAQFVFDRVPKPPEPKERKDLTDFAHSADACILRCTTCGVLRRLDNQDPLATYQEDSYDRAVMDRLFPRYAEAFAAKEDPYRSLLPQKAKVLEIGPHLGGFLEAATRWGWDAEGVEVGKDTAEYVQSRGFRTHVGTLQDCRFAEARFDAVFVWNCFEQVERPGELLAEIRRVLKADGPMVLRVPNARYYTTARCYLNSTTDPELTTTLTRALGYSNLLGWPYLYGYDAAHLDRLAGRHGFQQQRRLNAELIILPFPEVPDEVAAEKDCTLAAVQQLDRMHGEGPWIECIYAA